jgi:hypothetical protein
MIKINLQKINSSKKEDQQFLYEMLEYRWSKHDIINIKHKTNNKLSSFEDHVKHITSGKYKVFYRVNFGEISVGVIYIDQNNVNGTVIIPSKLKKALKKYNNQDLEINYTPISALIHIKLFSLHPEIKVHYASVNPMNTLSVRALLENGYEHIESIFAIQTQNGKVIQGKWQNYEESLQNSR